MTIKVDFTDPNFDVKFAQFEEELRWQIGAYIEAEAKKNAPVDSGNYRNNINFDGKKTITAGASYSAAIEYGTQPHSIEARTAEALHFVINGQEIFAKKVNHPGTKPNPVMRNAARTIIRDVLKETSDKLFKRYFNNV